MWRDVQYRQQIPTRGRRDRGYAINRKAPALSPAAAVNARIVGYTQAAYDALMSDDDRREIEKLAVMRAASIGTLHAVNGV